MAKILNTLGTLLVVCIILVSMPFFLPKVLGYQTFAVLTGSMEPEYQQGAMIYVKEAAPEEIVIGDVITYKMEASSGAVTTHRVVEIDTKRQEFMTKGDANEANDAQPIAFVRLVGKVVFSIPFLGTYAQFIQSQTGIVTGVGILVGAILLWIMAYVIKDKHYR